MREELSQESGLRDYCTLASRILSDMSSLCILLKSSANLCNRNRAEIKISHNHKLQDVSICEASFPGFWLPSFPLLAAHGTESWVGR